MKNSVKKMLAACLFVGMLGSSSVVLGNAANYQYVLSSSGCDKGENSGSSFVGEAVDITKKVLLVISVAVLAGAGVDMYKHGGFKGSKTEEFVKKAGELAGTAYFVPKEYIAGKVLPKIGGNEKFKDTERYLSTNSEKTNFIGEMKGFGSVLKELTLYACGAIKDFFSRKGK